MTFATETLIVVTDEVRTKQKSC